ncbi:hypothetical protein DM860_012410 [Cuscuta australis]|uniref:Replication protein A OB domain-containing protein n=1 Tax=Cuscuta australis TaxID=267555 RepID=A0A328DQ56_9ASTE|nr:hypothetical protein DM860_012410 [Cuscuta australis]
MGRSYMDGGSIKNFDVVDNKDKYRVVGDNKIMIQFNPTSSVRPAPGGGPEIPMHRFDFLDFDKVPTRLNQTYILTDVVGQVCSEGEAMDKNINNRVVRCLMLELQDLSGAKTRLTLWGKSVEDYITQKRHLRVL